GDDLHAISVGADNAVRSWDLRRAQLVDELTQDIEEDVSLASNGDCLVTNSDSREIALHRGVDLRHVATYPLPASDLPIDATNPDGSVAAGRVVGESVGCFWRIADSSSRLE